MILHSARDHDSAKSRISRLSCVMMDTPKSATQHVVKAVKALQNPKGSTTHGIKKYLVQEGLKVSNIKFALQRALNLNQLSRPKGILGRFMFWGCKTSGGASAKKPTCGGGKELVQFCAKDCGKKSKPKPKKKSCGKAKAKPKPKKKSCGKPKKKVAKKSCGKPKSKESNKPTSCKAGKKLVMFCARPKQKGKKS